MQAKSFAFGVAVVVLSGVAAFMGARLAQPHATDSGEDGDSGLQAQVEEMERDLANLKRQVDAIQEIAVSARDLAEGLRDRQILSPTTAPGAAAGSATSGAAVPGAQPGEAPPNPEAGMTDEQLRASHAEKIRSTVGRDVRALVPAMLASFADTKPGAEAGRRLHAAIEAKQLAVALAVTPDEATKLGELYESQADRLTREIGPLMTNGLDRADPTAVEAGLTRVWDDMDARAKEILGEERFVKFGESTVFLRTAIKDVLAERKKRR